MLFPIHCSYSWKVVVISVACDQKRLCDPSEHEVNIFYIVCMYSLCTSNLHLAIIISELGFHMIWRINHVDRYLQGCYLPCLCLSLHCCRILDVFLLKINFRNQVTSLCSIFCVCFCYFYHQIIWTIFSS